MSKREVEQLEAEVLALRARVQELEAQLAAPRSPARRRLPDERKSITHKFTIEGQDGYIHVGLYDDGAPGEVFIRMAKEGHTLAGTLDCFAIMVSLALQHGIPLRALVAKFERVSFEPAGRTNTPEIRVASSPVDYIFRWLALRFPRLVRGG